MSELKKCPFCGGDAEVVSLGDPKHGAYIVCRCSTCHAAVKGAYYRGEIITIPLEETVGGEKVMKVWNRRYEDRSIPGD